MWAATLTSLVPSQSPQPIFPRRRLFQRDSSLFSSQQRRLRQIGSVIICLPQDMPRQQHLMVGGIIGRLRLQPDHLSSQGDGDPFEGFECRHSDQPGRLPRQIDGVVIGEPLRLMVFL